jgi:hemolysin D
MAGRCAMPGPGAGKWTDGSRRGHEVEFLPAALALRETPPHPAPRIAMGLILLFALIALLWAVFGRIDIVASAHGKLIPDDRSKVIQSMETAAVLAIHVRDGQRVKSGDPLIEFDATQTLADTTRIGQDQLAARLEAARARALLAALESARPAPARTRVRRRRHSPGRRTTLVGRSAWGVARQAGTTRR